MGYSKQDSTGTAKCQVAGRHLSTWAVWSLEHSMVLEKRRLCAPSTQGIIHMLVWNKSWAVVDKGRASVSTIDYLEASKTFPLPQGAYQRLIELSIKTKKK